MNVAYKKPSLTLTKNVATSYGAPEGNCGETAKEKDAWWVINLETWHYVYGVGRQAFLRTVGRGKYDFYGFGHNQRNMGGSMILNKRPFPLGGTEAVLS